MSGTRKKRDLTTVDWRLSRETMCVETNGARAAGLAAFHAALTQRAAPHGMRVSKLLRQILRQRAHTGGRQRRPWAEHTTDHGGSAL